eukprot:TRINITY_DN10406_c0_g1_i1.p1 TRINITY_DN10406_c0_g1~~TRINITY_DN10406_c0_g1_i1.p1  ORF type:complete len:124 (+),score=22.63 TRINITY_DN10406_c0_g1_i1:44-373(+)
MYRSVTSHFVEHRISIAMDLAQREVLTVVKNDVYARFIKTNGYNLMLQELMLQLVQQWSAPNRDKYSSAFCTVFEFIANPLAAEVFAQVQIVFSFTYSFTHVLCVDTTA